MKKFIVILFILLARQSPASVIVLDYSDITPSEVIDFSGTVISSGGYFTFGSVEFSERFVGQTVTHGGTHGFHEILSGTATPALELTYDSTLDSLFRWSASDGDYLLGRVTTPSDPTNSVGEGSIAALFNSAVYEFGFDFIGVNGGGATVQLFDNLGVLLLSHSITGLRDGDSIAFRGDVGIAGFSLHNTDLAGIGIDNLALNINPVPLPGTFWLFGIGIGFVRLIASRIKS